MEIRPHVHSYDLEWEYDEPLSVHVVDADGETVLFGGGSADTADALATVATDHDVDVVVVEHGDGDHFGGIPALREVVPDIDVAVPAGDATFLEEADIDVDHELAAGETYWGVETIAAPGHTPDNMAYLYGDVLIAGDTVVAASSMFAAERDWSGPLAVITADFNADDEQTKASVSTLLDHEFDTVLVTHGENVETGGKEAVETLVDDLR